MKASPPKNTETVGSENLFKNISANKQQQLQQEFEALALPLMERLYSMALRVTRDQLDAEDLVQNTYLKAWFYFASFKSGSNFQGWIFQILINHFLNDCRRNRLRYRRQFQRQQMKGNRKQWRRNYYHEIFNFLCMDNFRYLVTVSKYREKMNVEDSN